MDRRLVGVIVPDLVGLTVELARSVGHEEGVVVVSTDLDGPPLGELAWPGVWIVTDQDPPAGAEVPRRTNVVIWFEPEDDGGDAGDRAPLRPRPDPLAMRAARRPEESDPDESVG